jgi:hypothetical protein
MRLSPWMFVTLPDFLPTLPIDVSAGYFSIASCAFAIHIDSWRTCFIENSLTLILYVETMESIWNNCIKNVSWSDTPWSYNIRCSWRADSIRWTGSALDLQLKHVQIISHLLYQVYKIICLRRRRIMQEYMSVFTSPCLSNYITNDFEPYLITRGGKVVA